MEGDNAEGFGREVRENNLFLTVTAVCKIVLKLRSGVKQCELEEWMIDFKCTILGVCETGLNWE